MTYLDRPLAVSVARIGIESGYFLTTCPACFRWEIGYQHGTLGDILL